MRRFLTRASPRAPLFQHEYDSGNQTITSGGALTLTHGLGGSPKLVMLLLKCVTGEAGYSAGDEVLIGHNQDIAGALSQGVSIVPNMTSIDVRFGSEVNAFSVLAKNNGVASDLTNANWALVVRAWR